MPFTSFDDLILSLTSGKKSSHQITKVSSAGGTSAAGRWHDTFTFTGRPGAGAYSGTAGVATQLNNSTVGSLIDAFAVSPETRHMVNCMAMTSSTTIAPATILLVDLLMYYPSCAVNTPTTLSNPVSLPRYTDGNGVYAFASVTGNLGASSPTITLSYTASDDTSGTTGGMISPANSALISTLIGANGLGPFFPLQSGHQGMKSINSYTVVSGATTGTVSLVLCKVLAKTIIPATNVAALTNFTTQIPSFPQIQDDACLSMLINLGANMTSAQAFFIDIETAWS